MSLAGGFRERETLPSRPADVASGRTVPKRLSPFQTWICPGPRRDLALSLSVLQSTLQGPWEAGLEVEDADPLWPDEDARHPGIERAKIFQPGASRFLA